MRPKPIFRFRIARRQNAYQGGRRRNEKKRKICILRKEARKVQMNEKSTKKTKNRDQCDPALPKPQGHSARKSNPKSSKFRREMRHNTPKARGAQRPKIQSAKFKIYGLHKDRPPNLRQKPDTPRRGFRTSGRRIEKNQQPCQILHLKQEREL